MSTTREIDLAKEYILEFLHEGRLEGSLYLIMNEQFERKNIQVDKANKLGKKILNFTYKKLR